MGSLLENWLAKNNPQSMVSSAGLGPSIQGLKGIDAEMTEDIMDKDFGIEAQLKLNEGFDWSNTGLGDISMKSIGEGAELASLLNQGYSSIFGDDKKKTKNTLTTQRQQIDYNNELKADRASLKNAWAATEANKVV